MQWPISEPKLPVPIDNGYSASTPTVSAATLVAPRFDGIIIKTTKYKPLVSWTLGADLRYVTSTLCKGLANLQERC
ncbi:hypothetical protein PTI98_010132 [Pleurotus ostreatus]|uniref:Uncharacterized protein n=1 Tax=Pleurotus cornucopiae TaxID=5321 RepID=A0ACB7J5S1_PLECO|nr:hypothetical protein CCMSSC00406_0002136 [Pleurotus cornucopiae]KAJ8692862.1 hypothetical protein PTI98_010132 [Pleurotus ostreatus]